MHRYDRAPPAVAGVPVTPGPAGRLEADAIGVAQDTVIGMASSAPAATAGLTLAALAAASAYGAGATLVLTAVKVTRWHPRSEIESATPACHWGGVARKPGHSRQG